MGELKPCPFCGGEAEVLSSIRLNEQTFFAWCDNCESRGYYYNTEADAVEAWNTRSERTCRIEVHGLERDRQISTVSYTCSECGKHIYRDDAYCKHCGAKVVE